MLLNIFFLISNEQTTEVSVFDIGKKAYYDLGNQFCVENLLNSPANFTASKLKWIKDNESELFSKIYKIMLPGDYIAYMIWHFSEMGMENSIFLITLAGFPIATQ